MTPEKPERPASEAVAEASSATPAEAATPQASPPPPGAAAVGGTGETATTAVSPVPQPTPAAVTNPPSAASSPPRNAPPAASADPAPGAAPALATKAPAAKPTDEFDPIGWEVPLLCKDCGKGFKVPYRHFQAGVVFHCPHCHGSFVPKVDIYRTVRETFETFYARRKRDREEFARIGGDEAAFRHKQERDLAQFHQMLDELAHAMRPAGKMVKPNWLRAMFT